MNPKVARYNKESYCYSLYFGECSTLAGLSFVNFNLAIKVLSLDASSDNITGWKDELDIQKIDTREDLVSYLNNDNDLSLVDFEIELDGLGTLSSHDDSECHFRLNEIHDVKDIITQAFCDSNYQLAIKNLFENAGKYIIDSSTNTPILFQTFDEYIKYCLTQH